MPLYPSSYGGSSIWYTLEYWGLSDAILPFILLFVIIYATLHKSKFLGENNRFNGVLAVVISLMVVVPHIMKRYPPGYDVVNIINSALPQVSVLIVAIVSFFIIIGIFGGRAGWGSAFSGIVVIGALIGVAIIFLNAANIYNTPNWLNFLRDSNTQAILVIIIVFGLLVWFITREPGAGTGMGGIRNALRGIGDFFR